MKPNISEIISEQYHLQDAAIQGVRAPKTSDVKI